MTLPSYVDSNVTKTNCFVLYEAFERQKNNLLFTDIIRIEAKFSFPCQTDITTFYLVQTGIS